MPEDEIEAIASTVRDKALRDTLVFGVAIHHAGLDEHDREVCVRVSAFARLCVSAWFIIRARGVACINYFVRVARSD